MCETGWLGVEPRHLTALIALDEEGSFRAAAKRLGLVQSALSQRIGQLECLLGVTLVKRSRGRTSLHLTEPGRMLLAHAKDIVAGFDAALCDVRSVDTRSRRVLRIGAYESVSSRLLPHALKSVREKLPDCAIDLREDAEWNRFFPLVTDGELDVAFADLPLEPGPFAHRELIVDPCVLIVSAASPLARAPQAPSLAEIAALPLVAGSWPMLGLISDQLRASGVEPRFAFTAATNAAVHAMVADGAGAALMPRLAVNTSDSRIAVVELDGALPARRIAAYWHRDRRQTDAISRFVAAVGAACQRCDAESVIPPTVSSAA
jgi:DNA-binding transcriptional LysR family regulator